MAMPEGTRLLLLAPVVRDRKGEYRKELAELQRRGFTRVKVDGKLYEIGEVPALNRKIKHEIEAVVDRVVVRDGIAPRLADSFETALAPVRRRGLRRERRWRRAHGVFLALRLPGLRVLHRGDRAPAVQLQLPAWRLPRLRRAGRGKLLRSRSWWCRMSGCALADGAVAPWTGAQSPYYDQTLQSLARHFKVTTKHALAGSAGEGARRDPGRHRRGAGRVHLQGRRARLHGDKAVRGRAAQPATPLAGNRQRLGARGNVALPGGKALRGVQRRAAEAGGAGGPRRRQEHRRGVGTFHPSGAPRGSPRCIDQLTPQRQEIARRILREICERLQFLVDVGLDYLTLSRGSATLSGGESQRIRLASQIGSGLTGVLYVLDEPSIGLHQRDNERLLGHAAAAARHRQHRSGRGT